MPPAARATRPNKVAIKNELVGESPSPARTSHPRRSAATPGDCPPGLPGCAPAKKSGGKGWGASCDKDGECGDGLACKSGRARAATSREAQSRDAGKSCEIDARLRCGREVRLRQGLRGRRGRGKKIWLSFNVQQDIGIISGERDVCGTAHHPAHRPVQLPRRGRARCCNQRHPYDRQPDAEAGNAINGGFKLATTRLLVGLDFLVGEQRHASARGSVTALNVGCAGRRSFTAEARVAYWFGSDPFKQKGIRPFFAVMGGYANMEAKFGVPIAESAQTVAIQRRTTAVCKRSRSGARAGRCSPASAAE